MCGRYVVKNPVTKTNKLVKSAIQVEDSDNYNVSIIEKRELTALKITGNQTSTSTWTLISSCMKLFFNFGFSNNDRATGITININCCSTHIENTICYPY